MSDLLKAIDNPRRLHTLTTNQLELIAEELRALILESVSNNGGHLASNLGVVELTLALHYCFDFQHKDRLVWDVGHQTYAHKILTGRREEFNTLRRKNGVSGYADKNESPYDTFSFGHTGTSISAALGLSCANDKKHFCDHVVAVIGDGAVASGMPFEAMNQAGELGKNLLIVLNDNQMSISPSVGSLSRYLSKIRSSSAYVGLKHEAHELISRWQSAFKKIDVLYERLADGLQSALTPGGLFTELGFHYYGPADGNDVREMVDTLQHVKRIEGPVLLHTLTKKGKGFAPASKDPASFHSSQRFNMDNGLLLPQEAGVGGDGAGPRPSWSQRMGEELVRLADVRPELLAITAAMPEGTGLKGFSEKHPDKFYDVGICEQHAVGLAGGLAAGGLRPVVCIYSTFLQRAYDQIFHDIALQSWPVVFCVDRAGLVGSDGATHHGLYDIAYFRCFPGLNVMAPADVKELHAMLELALSLDQPSAIRYPREPAPISLSEAEPELEAGRAQTLKEGSDGVFIAYGATVQRAVEAANILARDGKSIAVINARFAKPIDIDLIGEAVANLPAAVIAEDHARAGGFSSAVLEALNEHSIPAHGIAVAAVPDRFIAHAGREDQLASLGLDGPGLAARMEKLIAG